MNPPFVKICAVDERQFRKTIHLLPENTSSIAASFFEWPPSELDFEEDEELNFSRYYHRRLPQPPQKSLCFAATLLSQYLADHLGPNTADSPFAFAFTGAIALRALGISDRPTGGLDILFEGDLRALMAHMFQSPMFILPSSPYGIDSTFQFFLKVGPGQGHSSLVQDDIIHVHLNSARYTGGWPIRNRWVETNTRCYDTDLRIRSLNPLGLLNSKLRTYVGWTRRRDWLDIYDIVESSANWIDMDRLEPDTVFCFFEHTPEGLVAPKEWYDRYKARIDFQHAQGLLRRSADLRPSM